MPGTVTLTPKQIHVDYVDNGASGDWLPCVTFISDAGVVLGRAVDQAVKVTAGSDASVTWFPGIKNAGAGFTSASLNQSLLLIARHGNQAITSGVVTPITFTTGTSAPGYSPGLFGNTPGVANPVTFANFGTAAMTLTVRWPAASFDRYIELAIANPTDANDTYSPRARSQISPDGDVMTLSAIITGGPVAPDTTVTANVFQASGVNQNITAEWSLKGINGVIFLS